MNPAQNNSPAGRYWLLCILGFTLCAYAAGLPGVLFFDDIPALVDNPSLNFDNTLFDSWRLSALSSNSGPLGRPLAMLSFAANDLAPTELKVVGLKLTNILIHLMVGYLVMLVSRVIFRHSLSGIDGVYAHYLALFVASLWLLHPLHVSTVLYAVQRMAQLSTLFMLLGLYQFLSYRSRWAESGGSAGEILALLVWLSLLGTLAVYCKENGALLPWFILVVEVCLFKGLWAGRTNVALKLSAIVLLTIPLLLTIAWIVNPPGFIQSGYTIREFDVYDRLMTQLRVSWHYVGWLFWPSSSSLGFHHDDIALSRSLLMPASTLLALIAWITVLLTSVYLRNRTPLLLFGVLFFIVGHSMESSFLALEMVYEHRNYLPSMGVFIAFVGCCHICFYREGMKRLYRYVPAITIPILFTLLLIRAESWSQALTLSGENVRVHPLSVRSNYAHGYSFLSLADDESLDSVQQVVALRASRQYFLRMHEIDQDDLAALVSLYRIDSSYFGQADQAAVWLELGYKAVNSKTLQPSDVSALNVLIECLVASGCEADSAIIWRILEVLDKKYPSNQHYIALRYRYLKFQGRDAQMRSDLAAKSIALQPYNPGFYRERIYQCSQIGDVDCMYENISQWFFYDSQRRDTLSIKRLFLVSDK